MSWRAMVCVVGVVLATPSMAAAATFEVVPLPTPEVEWPYPTGAGDSVGFVCRIAHDGTIARAEVLLGPMRFVLRNQGDGIYRASDGLTLPLAPGRYTARFEVELRDGRVTSAEQTLVLLAPEGVVDPLPWLPSTIEGFELRPVEVPALIWVDGVQRLVFSPVGGAPEEVVAVRLDRRAGWVVVPDAAPGTIFEVQADDASWARRYVTRAASASVPSSTVKVASASEGGCASGGGARPVSAGWALALVAGALVVGRRRRAVALALGVAALCGGCGDVVASREVAGRVALVEEVAAGTGPTNTRPLWPLALGDQTLSAWGYGAEQVVASWPVSGGTGLRVEPANTNEFVNRGPLDLVVDDEGAVWLDRAARGGKLSHPLLLLPATVREGMVWRSVSRPPKQRFDLLDNIFDDEGDTWEFKVIARAAQPEANGGAVAWWIAWKGPLCNVGVTLGDRPYPRRPVQGMMVFVEGQGPMASPQYAMPPLATDLWRCDGQTSALEVEGVSFEPPELQVRVVQAPERKRQQVPTASLSPARVQSAREGGLDGLWPIDLSLLDLGERGLWVRLDGMGGSLGYDVIGSPGGGGVGGNATKWQGGPGSACLRLDGDTLTPGDETGALEEGQTCRHAAASWLDASGRVHELPYNTIYGKPTPTRTLNFGDTSDRRVAAVAILGAGDQRTALVPLRDGLMREVVWADDPKPTAPLYSWPSPDVELREVPTPAGWRDCDGGWVTFPLAGGAQALVGRQLSTFGRITHLCYARMSATGALEGFYRVGAVAGGVSARVDASGPELLQLEPDGTLWRLEPDATTLRRRPLARLKLPADEWPVAAVRTRGDQLLVVTTHGAGMIYDFTAFACDEMGYCTGNTLRPPLDQARVWTARLGDSTTRDLEPLPTSLTLSYERPGFGTTNAKRLLCAHTPEVFASVVVDGKTVAADLGREGACLDLDAMPWAARCAHTLVIEGAGARFDVSLRQCEDAPVE